MAQALQARGALAELMDTFLRRLSEALAAWEIPPAYAAVFGSAARGTMSLDSDLDLLLIRPDEADETRWDAQVDSLVQAVNGWLGNDTRPLQFAAAEVLAAGGDLPVLAEVLREGLTVAGDRRCWPTSSRRRPRGTAVRGRRF